MDAQRISEGIGQTASKYGADLLETAEAAKTLAQAGYNATTIMRELDYTMMGMRGMGMTIEQMQELQIAVRAVTGELDNANSSLQILEKLSQIESGYAVSAQQLADAIRISAPFLREFSQNMRGMKDVFDYTIGFTTTAVEQLRISGTQAGNALKFIGARLLQPRISKRLQEQFGVNLAREGGTEMLPINEIMDEVHTKYRGLKDSGQGAKADQLLATVAGAHRVNYLAAVLNNYDRALDITAESSYAFAGAQRRTDITLDTMAVTVQRLRTNFQLLFNNMADGTAIADGLKFTLGALGNVMGGVSGTGLGTVGGIGMMAAGFGAWQLGKKGIRNLDTMQKARSLGVDYVYLKSALDARRASQLRAMLPSAATEASPILMADGTAYAGAAARAGAGAAEGGMLARAGSGIASFGGAMAATFGPTGAIVLGLAAALGVTGLIYRLWKRVSDDTDQYRIKLRDIQDLKLWDAPQFREMDALAEKYGMTSAPRAYEATLNAFTGPTMDPGIARVMGRYGANNMSELLGIANKNKLDKPDIANEIIDAFVNSKALGEAGSKLKDIEDQALRVAEATRLIGLAAWAANYRIAQSIEALRDSTTRMIESTAGGLAILDTRNRHGMMATIGGAMGDFFKGRSTLQSTAGLAVNAQLVNYGVSNVADPMKARDSLVGLLRDAEMPTGLVRLFQTSETFCLSHV
jgi:hypothetical protein